MSSSKVRTAILALTSIALATWGTGCGAAATTVGYQRCSVADAAFAFQIQEGGKLTVGSDLSVTATGPVTGCVGKETAVWSAVLPQLIQAGAKAAGP